MILDHPESRRSRKQGSRTGPRGRNGGESDTMKAAAKGKLKGSRQIMCEVKLALRRVETRSHSNYQIAYCERRLHSRDTASQLEDVPLASLS